MAAGAAVGGGVVTGMGQLVRYAEAQAFADDGGFGELDQRGVDVESLGGGLDAGFGAQVGDFLEGLDELGPAIGVAGVIDGVDADEDIEGT